MSFSALFPSHFVVESLRAVTVNPERSTVCADTLLFMTAPSRPITIIGVEEKASVKFTLASTVEEAFTLTLPRFINIFLLQIYLVVNWYYLSWFYLLFLKFLLLKPKLYYLKPNLNHQPYDSLH